MNDCLFCKINQKELPSYTIYEDEVVKVFLDIHPSTNGDCLLIPKKHIVTIEEVDEELMIHMLKVIKKIKKMLEEKLSCDGLTIAQNNGHGQEVKHFHIHLTPRYKYDGLKHCYDESKLVQPEDVFDELQN